MMNNIITDVLTMMYVISRYFIFLLFLNLSKIRKSFDQQNLKTLKEILHNPADI